MALSTQLPPPRSEASSTSITPACQLHPSQPLYSSSHASHFTGWFPLLGMSLVVLSLLAGAALFSPTGLSLESLFAWDSGLYQSATQQPGTVSTLPTPTTGTAVTALPAIPCTMQDTAVFRKHLDVGGDQHICGNVDVFGGGLTIANTAIVDGNVTITGGTATIYGTVHGSITALDANVDLRSGANIGGDIQVVGGTVTRDQSGVTVGGSIQQGVDPQQISPPHWLGINSSYDFPWSRLIFWVLSGVALTVLFPKQMAFVRRAARDSLPSAFFVGILSAIVGTILAVILFLTCLGIPLALLLAAALTVASVVGTAALGLWLGERLLGYSRTARRASVLPALVGITVLALLQTAPCIGGVVTVLTSCAGLGAAILALIYARRRAVWTADGLL